MLARRRHAAGYRGQHAPASALADLLRAGFFSPSDYAALHLATRLLLSDEDACRASISEAVRRDLFWLVPRTHHNAEAIADRLPDCRPIVVLMNPPFSATPGVGRIRHDADLRHLRTAFAMLPPGARPSSNWSPPAQR